MYLISLIIHLKQSDKFHHNKIVKSKYYKEKLTCRNGSKNLGGIEDENPKCEESLPKEVENGEWTSNKKKYI